MRSPGSARVLDPEDALGRDHRRFVAAASPSLAAGGGAGRAQGTGRVAAVSSAGDGVAPPSRRRRRHGWWSLLGVAAVWLGGCGGGSRDQTAGDTLTTRERQEAIGRSGLPGATGINRALDVADSATARQAELDSLIHSR